MFLVVSHNIENKDKFEMSVLCWHETILTVKERDEDLNCRSKREFTVWCEKFIFPYEIEIGEKFRSWI